MSGIPAVFFYAFGEDLPSPHLPEREPPSVGPQLVERKFGHEQPWELSPFRFMGHQSFDKDYWPDEYRRRGRVL